MHNISLNFRTTEKVKVNDQHKWWTYLLFLVKLNIFPIFAKCGLLVFLGNIQQENCISATEIYKAAENWNWQFAGEY